MPASFPSCWEGTAFGLALHSEFELPGLSQVDAPHSEAGERRVRLVLGAAEDPAHEWGERLQEWRYPDGRIGLAIDHHAARGYRFYVLDAGVFELSPDGADAVCRPAPNSAWRWRRYLTGQVLPFAALLQGLEVLHASAVELNGAAVAIAGGSGLGKSTLALNMHLAGAGFLADDVIAVEGDGAVVVAHPGVATAKLRRVVRDLLPHDRHGTLGEVISEDEHEIRFGVTTSAALPLRAICMLERSGGAGEIEVLAAEPDPWYLLGSTFNLLVQDDARLQAQLDLCAAIARQAAFLRVRVGERPGPEAAAQLAAHLRDLL
jgi:hypothetical protein